MFDPAPEFIFAAIPLLQTLSKSGVPMLPIEQRPPEHASLEDGRQGDDGDECGLELHEDEEDEGGRQEPLQGPAEALEGKHVDPKGEEDPGHDEDGDEHGEGREDVAPEAAEESGGQVGVLLAGRTLPGSEGAPEPLAAVVLVGLRRRWIRPLPSPCLSRRGRAGPRVAVDHVGQYVPQEVAGLLAVHVAVHFLPAVRAVAVARRTHELLEQVREVRVHVGVAVTVAVVVVAGTSFLSSLSVRRTHDAVGVLLLLKPSLVRNLRLVLCRTL